MFLGAIPPQMQQVVSETAAEWTPTNRDLYVGCSGNLTVERLLASQGWRSHSCDVTLYSCALGAYFSGMPVWMQPNELCHEKYPWVAEHWTDEPSRQTALVMLMSSLMQQGASKNRHSRRMAEAYRDQFPAMLAKTEAKLQAAHEAVKLASFAAEDVFSWIERVPADAPMISFPPFYAGGYETMFTNLANLFEWDEPAYSIVDETNIEDLYGKIADRREYMLCTNRPVDWLEDRLRSTIKTSPRSARIFIYSSGETPRLVVPAWKRAEVDIPTWPVDEEITGDETMTMLRIPLPVFRSVRDEYMTGL